MVRATGRACCDEGTGTVPAPAPGAARALRVALVGNPNVGKSTVFNAVTGARRRTGNWPGTTVEVANGSWSLASGTAELLDLPGTYSLDPRSPDEALVRDLLTDRADPDRPDLVVAVLDAANLARNLYLLAQVLDTGLPVVVALTMLDVAEARGRGIDRDRLAALLGVPVVEVRPRTGAGLDRLATAVAAARGEPAPAPSVPARPGGAEADGFPAATGPAGADDDDPEVAEAERRYAWVRRIVAGCVTDAPGDGRTLSDRVDRVATSPWAGPLLFLLVMWGVFVATTELAAPLQEGLTELFDGPVIGAAEQLLAWARLDGTWVAGLVTGGLVPGVGAVLSFVPLMAIMFVLLTLLEGSGYLARAAFVADRLLRLVGLPGRAFLPLVVGFGCNVPAVAATRVLPDARHRLMTGLLVPFVSCSARLTVYLLLANLFFSRHAGSVVFAMYVLSVVLVVLAGLVLRRTVFRGMAPEALILELPPYRVPSPRVIVGQSWQRLAGFLRTAGGIIVVTTAAVWLLTAVPLRAGTPFGEVPVSDSLYGGASRSVAVVFEPAGFGDWHTTGALVSGFVAKEAVVSTFAQTYGTREPGDVREAGDLGVRLRETFDEASGGHPLPAVAAFMVFLLAYTPCAATVAAQRAEFGTRWALVGVGVQLALAYVLAVGVFQVGRLVV
ncbi:ferrous iron transport protein B [Streptomyces sp. NPDC047886]|uniref:ferrous iron transport protein B n=1 Tax=Streptomyces sp. NPDC047886 TaxID=3365490 RepID=UPI00371917E6